MQYLGADCFAHVINEEEFPNVLTEPDYHHNSV